MVSTRHQDCDEVLLLQQTKSLRVRKKNVYSLEENEHVRC